MGKVIADMGNISRVIRMNPLELSADKPLHGSIPIQFHQTAEAV